MLNEIDTPGDRKGCRVGSLTLQAPVLMAAMAGYTDRAMRRLVREQGAAYASTGALLDRSLTSGKVLRLPEFRLDGEARPVGAQIIGHDPQTMADAARALVAHGFDVIDLNFACPVRKVLTRERGGWMLFNPAHAAEVFARVREAVNVPLVVKLRRGWDDTAGSREDFCTLVERLARAGADALIVHGRTVEQQYHGRADWTAAIEVKRRFPRLTVIGSGDVRSVAVAVERLQSGVDAIAVGRGAVGDPWLFAGIRAALAGQPEPPPPGLAEQREMIERHLALAAELYGFAHALRRLRKFWMRYARHHPERRRLREAFTQVRTSEAWQRILDEFYR